MPADEQVSTAGKEKGVCVCGRAEPWFPLPLAGLHPAGLAPRRLLRPVLQLLFPHLPLVPESPGSQQLVLGSLGSWGEWPLVSCVFPGPWPAPAGNSDLQPHFTQCWFWLHHLARACRINAFPMAARRACGCFCSPELPHGMCTAAAPPALAIHSALVAFLSSAPGVLKTSFSP